MQQIHHAISAWARILLVSLEIKHLNLLGDASVASFGSSVMQPGSHLRGGDWQQDGQQSKA